MICILTFKRERKLTWGNVNDTGSSRVSRIHFCTTEASRRSLVEPVRKEYHRVKVFSWSADTDSTEAAADSSPSRYVNRLGDRLGDRLKKFEHRVGVSSDAVSIEGTSVKELLGDTKVVGVEAATDSSFIKYINRLGDRLKEVELTVVGSSDAGTSVKEIL